MSVEIELDNLAEYVSAPPEWPLRRSRSVRCRTQIEAALASRPGTRAITSITRWKRSISLGTAMSNGVVVVPSSLQPRTCRL